MNKLARFTICVVLATLMMLESHFDAQIVYGQEDYISFSDPKNPDELNPLFQWNPGDESSAYIIEDDGKTVTIGTGPKTTSRINIPIKGDFTAQVQVTTNISVNEWASFGVLKDQSELFMRFDRSGCCDSGVNVLQRKTTSSDYSWVLTENGRDQFCCWSMNKNITIFFKIEKRRTLYGLYFSEDGVKWSLFRKNFAMPITGDITLFLGISSYDGGQSSSATFTKLSVIAK